MVKKYAYEGHKALFLHNKYIERYGHDFSRGIRELSFVKNINFSEKMEQINKIDPDLSLGTF